MCARAFGVCKYINASESRQIEKEGKKEEKKKVGAENEWETHELFYAFSMLIVVKEEEREREREKGNETEEKEQNRNIGQATIGKNKLKERKKKQSRLEMYIDVQYVQKKCTRTYIAAISRIAFFLNFRTRVRPLSLSPCVSLHLMFSFHETLRIGKRTDAQTIKIRELRRSRNNIEQR